MALRFICSLLFVVLLIVSLGGVESKAHHREKRRVLFVFGDSYADTGNFRKSVSPSWKQPYGITFPGKPAGRFSDGRVLTDFLAKFLGVRSPIPYTWRKINPSLQRYGVNFAIGGTGVFTTLNAMANMTVQIDSFERLLRQGVICQNDLDRSVALVSLAGNDYSAYLERNGSAEGLQPFIIAVVKQLSLNLQRLQGLGVKKIAVTTMEPLGCLPSSTQVLSYKQCNETQNAATSFHNLLLEQEVQNLNKEANNSSNIVIFDLFNSFNSVLKTPSGQGKFVDSLRPCCDGFTVTDRCGSIDKSGRATYNICSNPETTFFWDSVHPTQSAWAAIVSYLRPSVEALAS
ncbi:GDSL esterase/lipase At5g03610 [Amborella trichopoda]|uniref:SGNH hydrolase-type esterase domain-containing protein n=1 Tax=Amborella trichopoda TaxID=13333 RepID=W1PYE3_AMBTC|nr:GDSL esterase/lipase At5g03610 [Amborella trichopoda]ERN13089.1 hypothetical protein AMTR_s00040p00157200 [Amborella trichopoda]|eukprot:XP_006851508.1 GDSL esterase/lipase At5g03610 [Amborella trichopoda]